MFKVNIDHKSKCYDIITAVILLPTIFILFYGVLQLTSNIFHSHTLLLIFIIYMPLFCGLIWLSNTSVKNYKEVLKLKELITAYENYHESRRHNG